MADLTWYSREGADQRFLTRSEAGNLASKTESAQADAALGARIDAVKATAEAALPAATASTTYATKAEVEEVRQQAQRAPQDSPAPAVDLSPYAKTADVTSADEALGKRIDQVSAVASAAAPSSALSDYATSAAVAGTYATKEALADYLKAADASDTYATKAQLAQAQIDGAQNAPDLSGLATKAEMRQADAALGARIDAVKATAEAGGQVDLSGYVTTADAVAKFADKETVQAVSTKADEASSTAAAAETKAATAVQPNALAAYATTEALAKVKQAADEAASTIVPPFRSGERYASPVTYYWPDYYNEKQGTSKWAKALKAAGTLGIVILNKDSGNWDEKNEDFGKQAARALAAGARRAVFYVKTQYGVASLPSSDPARNGVPNPDKYTKEYILGQIAKFTEQYGDVAQGVFLDETINGWGAQAGRVQWYKDLIAAIREQYGQNFYIVVNAGSNMSPEMCALDFDTAMMFEQDAGKFLNEDANAPVLPDHMRSYPSEKWWAVIHGVTKDNYRQVFEKLDTLPIGHAYITDGVLVEDPNRGGQWEPVGNPYANPPSEQLIKLTSSWIRGTLGLALEVEDLKAQVEALKKAAPAAGAGAGQAGKLLVLGPNDPVPAGTADDTVIIRREA